MNFDKYLSPLFGSPGWYKAIQDTYNFKNPFEKKNCFGLQVPFKKVYSLLPFSDWYFEVDNTAELKELKKLVSKTFGNDKFEARVLVKNLHESPVSTYRLDRLDPESRFKAMNKTTRRYTRKALKNELVLEIGDLSDVDRFFKLHALTRKKLGLPVQPKVFFENIMKNLPSSQFAFCVTKEGADAAAFLLLKKDNVLYYKYGASNPDLLSVRPNHFLFYQLHDIAKNANIDTIDLGRTDEPGLHQFKASLGATQMAIQTFGFNEKPENHEESHAILKIRKLLAHLPVQFHIITGKLFYKYLA